ncbi:MAG: PCRF domain-containing protein [Candidatus Colwellbacteria bacterium]|nr:PCRF domain-containing protein [Candidatus Colwellbacteria bacterium]
MTTIVRKGDIITISVFPGVGGQDAKDWAVMLLRMYERYAGARAWRAKHLNEHTLELRGEGAYGRLRLESGVHRLVRISPYDAKKLRHTSFALIEVLPELPPVEAAGIAIPDKDMKVEFNRSSGPGGQNVNKVETAVRIVHLPTGVHAASQSERSQSQNRERALSLLKSKLAKLMEERRETELSNLRVKVTPEWSNQIRSYVLHPYQLVKDHRTNEETRRVHDVLDGDLDLFIEAELTLEKIT